MHLVLVCGMILLVEMLERLVSLCLSNASLGLNLRIPLSPSLQAYYGMASDMQIYLTSVLGLSTAQATSDVSCASLDCGQSLTLPSPLSHAGSKLRGKASRT